MAAVKTAKMLTTKTGKWHVAYAQPGHDASYAFDTRQEAEEKFKEERRARRQAWGQAGRRFREEPTSHPNGGETVWFHEMTSKSRPSGTNGILYLYKF